MPIYEYHCKKCNTYFERILPHSRIDEPIADPCPNEECSTLGEVQLIIAGKFLDVQPDWKPKPEFNHFLNRLKNNTKGASDFRTY
jgi:putative FmdB family regulatory protein